MSSTSLSNVLVSWNAFSASSLVLVEAYEKNPDLQSVDGSEEILSPPGVLRGKGKAFPRRLLQVHVLVCRCLFLCL